MSAPVSPLSKRELWLASLAVGDEVVISRDGRLKLARIEKIGALHIHVGKHRFLRRNGRASGQTNNLYPTLLREVADGDRALIEREQLVDTLSSIVANPHTSTEALREMLAAATANQT